MLIKEILPFSCPKNNNNYAATIQYCAELQLPAALLKPILHSFSGKSNLIFCLLQSKTDFVSVRDVGPRAYDLTGINDKKRKGNLERSDEKSHLNDDHI